MASNEEVDNEEVDHVQEYNTIIIGSWWFCIVTNNGYKYTIFRTRIDNEYAGSENMWVIGNV